MGKLIKSLKFGPNSEVYDVGVTTKDIIVTGISLIGGLTEGMTIPAGTSMDDFVSKLTQREQYPNPKYTTYSYKGSVSISPTITIKTTNNSNIQSTTIYAHIGEELELYIGSVSRNNWTYNKIKNQISNLSYGYAHNPGSISSDTIYTNSDNDTVRLSDNSIASPRIEITIKDGSQNTKFTQTKTGTKSDPNNPEKVISETNLASGDESGEDTGFGGSIFPYIEEGLLNLNIKITPQQQEGYVKGLSSVYILSNLHNLNANQKTTTIEDVGSSTNYSLLGCESKTLTYTIYGTYYKYFGRNNDRVPEYSDIKNHISLIQHDFSRSYREELGASEEDKIILNPKEVYYLFLPNNFNVRVPVDNGKAYANVQKKYSNEQLINLYNIPYNIFYIKNDQATGKTALDKIIITNS